MLKIKKVEVEDRYLKLYFKIKVNYRYSFNQIKHLLNKEYTFEPSIDETSKYIILTYILRDKRDILPYLNIDLKDIYERLNEIQYLLKFTYAKKKIRRKVKEVMNLIVEEDNE